MMKPKAWTRSWPALGVLAALPLGCLEDPPPLGRTAQALAPTVSTPFDVEPAAPVLTSDASPYLDVKTACGQTQCLAAFYQSLGPGETDEWATRFGPSAVPTDLPRLRLDPAGGHKAVTPMGEDFVVLSTTGTTPAFTSLQRIRGSDGVRTDLVTAGLPTNYYSYLAATASSLLLLSRNDQVRAHLYGSDLKPIGTAMELPGSPTSTATVIVGDNQYLIVSPDSAVRMDTTTGAILDATPIPFTKYLPMPPTMVGGAYRDGVYLLSWFTSSNNDINSVRISAADGSMLDPPDDFNLQSGQKLLCADCVSRSYGTDVGLKPDVDVIDGEFTVTWLRSVGGSSPETATATLHGFTVDATTGLRPGGATTLPPAIADLAGAPEHVVHGVGGQGVLQYGNSLRTLQSSTAAAGFVLGEPSPVALRAADRSVSEVASNGTTFLVVHARGGLLYATRIDAASGAVLDDPPLALGTAGRATIASDGSSYMVVWPKNWEFFSRAMVAADGTVTALPDLPTDYSPSVSYEDVDRLSLAFNGTNYFLAWTQSIFLRGKRMAADGTALDTTARNLDGSESVGLWGIAALGDSTPPANQRTFLVLFANTDLVMQRLRSESGVLAGITTIAANVNAQPILAAASDGTRAMVAYQPATSATVYATYVDPVTGVAATPPVSWTPGASGAMQGGWYDGRSFNLLFNGALASYGPTMHYLQRFAGADLARLDGNLPGLGHPIVGVDATNSVRWASAGNGRSLLAYNDTEPALFGTRVMAVLIDNDGLEAPVPVGTGGQNQGGTGSGGSSSPGLGGSNASLGGSGALGGTSSHGGVAAAGAPNGGGGSSSGGSTVSGAGPGSGGAQSIGGSIGLGGANATAGASPLGGTKPASGGSSASGAAGGAALPAGGSAVTDAGTATSGTAGDAAPGAEAGEANGTSGAASGTAVTGSSELLPEDSGCGCRLTGQPGSPDWYVTALFGLGWCARRRRAQHSRRNPLNWWTGDAARLSTGSASFRVVHEATDSQPGDTRSLASSSPQRGVAFSYWKRRNSLPSAKGGTRSPVFR